MRTRFLRFWMTLRSQPLLRPSRERRPTPRDGARERQSQNTHLELYPAHSRYLSRQWRELSRTQGRHVLEGHIGRPLRRGRPNHAVPRVTLAPEPQGRHALVRVEFGQYASPQCKRQAFRGSSSTARRTSPSGKPRAAAGQRRSTATGASPHDESTQRRLAALSVWCAAFGGRAAKE